MSRYPKAFVAACAKFIYVENLTYTPPDAAPATTKTKATKMAAQLALTYPAPWPLPTTDPTPPNIWSPNPRHRVLPVIDGLDEVPPATRENILHAPDRAGKVAAKYHSARFQLVLSLRSELHIATSAIRVPTPQLADTSW